MLNQYQNINTDSTEILEENALIFRKVSEPFGELHNMHNGFPLTVMEHRIKSSEALYQMLKYPHHSDVQHSINNQPHAYVAKRYAYHYDSHKRSDWFDVSVPIMYWVVKLKVLFYWKIFSPIYVQHPKINIVEWSKKEEFWGAKLKQGIFYGSNVLGKIHMCISDEINELYPQVQSSSNSFIYTLEPLNIPDFKLFNKFIPPIDLVLEK